MCPSGHHVPALPGAGGAVPIRAHPRFTHHVSPGMARRHHPARPPGVRRSPARALPGSARARPQRGAAPQTETLLQRWPDMIATPSRTGAGGRKGARSPAASAAPASPCLVDRASAPHHHRHHPSILSFPQRQRRRHTAGRQSCLHRRCSCRRGGPRTRTTPGARTTTTPGSASPSGSRPRPPSPRPRASWARARASAELCVQHPALLPPGLRPPHLVVVPGGGPAPCNHPATYFHLLPPPPPPTYLLPPPPPARGGWRGAVPAPPPPCACGPGG